ncbi:glutathione S-transferase N-terminal domain-containing protein [Xylophilus sp. GW821-FHT01B05]
MQLKFSPFSPYVRKVMVLAHELGLDARIEKQPVAQSPYEPAADVGRLNPLGKVPVLVTDDGVALFDSTVACEYLSHLAGDEQWFPPPGITRWEALRCNAVAGGLLEAAQLCRMEAARPAGMRYAKWSDAQMRKVVQALDFLEVHLPTQEDIGAISVACALGWQDLRWPDLGWRDGRPALQAWFGQFAGRASFACTAPPGQT